MSWRSGSPRTGRISGRRSASRHTRRTVHSSRRWSSRTQRCSSTLATPRGSFLLNLKVKTYLKVQRRGVNILFMVHKRDTQSDKSKIFFNAGEKTVHKTILRFNRCLPKCWGRFADIYVLLQLGLVKIGVFTD